MAPTFLEAMSSTLTDRVVFPKLKNALILHSTLTLVAFLIWRLATGNPAPILSVDFTGRACCIMAIQSICIAAALLRRSTSSPHKKKLEELALLGFITLLGGLFVAAVTASVTWMALMPGPVYIMLMKIRPLRPMLSPLVRKPKVLELKERLKSNMYAMALVTSLLLGLRAVLGSALKIHHGLEVEGSVSMCLFLWLSGVDFLEANVNQGHKFRLSSSGRNSLPRALVSKNEVKRVLAYADLCQLSEERGMSTGRRIEMFELEGSEPATIWNMVATSCLGEIQALIAQLGACVARDCHEVIHGISPTRLVAHRKNVDLALEHVQARFHKLSMSARSLAGLASASQVEDQMGIVRTGSPGLATVTGTLIEGLVMLDNLIREKESWRSYSAGLYPNLLSKLKSHWGWHREPIDDTASLYFVLRGCLAGMCNSFGRTYLMQETSRIHPRHMTVRALQNGLLGVLDCEE